MVARLGSGLISSGPDSHCCECDGGEEVSRQLVEPRCDAPEVLELVEEAFDPVALAVDCRIDTSLHSPVPLRRDVGFDATGLRQIDQRAGVVAAVRDQVTCLVETGDQLDSGFLVRCLTGRERQPDRQTVAIDDGVDLGAQSSTRTANGVIRTPFFPPAAC